jgi:hypothetical protein
VETELRKLIGQQVPIKTRTGGRMMDYIAEVGAGVVILATNADGTGRRTVLSLDCVESVTTGTGTGVPADAGTPAAAAKPPRPNWMPVEEPA